MRRTLYWIHGALTYLSICQLFSRHFRDGTDGDITGMIPYGDDLLRFIESGEGNYLSGRPAAVEWNMIIVCAELMPICEMLDIIL